MEAAEAPFPLLCFAAVDARVIGVDTGSCQPPWRLPPGCDEYWF